MSVVYLVPLVALLGFLYMFVRASWINKQSIGTPEMERISKLIANGAMSFLKAEYRVLAIFIVITTVLLGGLSLTDANSSPLIMLAFVVGAVFSGTAGFIGMRVATRANVRTANAARTSLSKALDISFAGGTVMGTGVVSLGLLGLSLLFLLFNYLFNVNGTDAEMMRVLNVLTGFSLGAESIALFARVGGGIYTKAADVGADLAGKVVAGIPEDDPRNPAVIADNVGDNVGDVAGMGADLFGSYVSTVLATMVLGVLVKANSADQSFAAVYLPLAIAAIGTIFSMIAFFAVKVKEGGDPQSALNRGNFLAIALTAIASYFVITNILPADCQEFKKLPDGTLLLINSFPSINIFFSVLIGLAVGGLISVVTEFYCAMGRRPVLSIVKQSLSSPATNIIGGLSVGMESTALPTIILASGIVGSYVVGGLFGVAMAAAGMMATTGIQLAIDAFGPIADNAGGIAEMSGLPKEVRKNTDTLDAVGNTTAAIGKGFAIASAALTALALFAAFMEITHLSSLDIANPRVLGGMLIGGMIPYLFSSMAISSVGRAANAMVQEVKRQFDEIKGLLQGKEGVFADYDTCITISTKAALREMMAPGLLALLAPTVVGFAFGPAVLGGLLAGILVSGLLLAMFQSNAGGAWDNAKKSFEAGVVIDGTTHYKGGDVHKNSIVGDTVGDPFKDTSGPSMNILIKLSMIVALIIAPYIAKIHPVDHSQNLPGKPTIEQVK